MATTLQKQFIAARRVSVPLLAIETPDQPATIAELTTVVEAYDKATERDETPLLVWDAVSGMRGANESGGIALKTVAVDDETGEAISGAASADPIVALEIAAKLAEAARNLDGDRWQGPILFLMQFGEFLRNPDPRIVTGVANLREAYKARNCCAVLLGVSFTLPDALATECIPLRQPLPDDDALRAIVDDIRENYALPEFDATTSAAIVSALRGLSVFVAEQQAYLSVERENGKASGVNVRELWKRKATTLEKVKGIACVRYDRGQPNNVKGLAGLQRNLARIFSENNPKRPQLIVHIDEAEKQLAASGERGAGQDSSGVTQDAIGVILRYAQDNGWNGIAFVGPAGVGKTFMATTVAETVGVPYTAADLPGCQSKYVGESQTNVRTLMETLNAVGNKRVFLILTCNSVKALPSALLSRLRAGIYYCGFPTGDDAVAIWDLYRKQFGIDEPVPQALLNETLTGREIHAICEKVGEQGYTYAEARETTTPEYLNTEAVVALQREALNRYIDAATGKPYNPATSATTSSAKRAKGE